MQQELLDFVSQELLSGRGDATVTAGDDLLGSGLVDSMGIMRLIGFVEQEFDVTVPPEDVTIENFMTIERISQYLENRISSNGHSTLG